MTTLFEAFNTTGLTENGCVTNLSSLDANLDLFFAVGASRGKDITPLFTKALAENSELATRILLWSRDIREGSGERQTFKNLVKHMICMQDKKEFVSVIIDKIPELGRFDDLEVFIGTEFQDKAVKVWLNAIEAGNGLAAKWMPVKDKKGAKPFRKALDMNEDQFRKYIVPKRRTVEQDICAKTFENIDYSKVPSKASLVHMTTFHKFDNDRYQAFKDALVKGETKINAGAVYPYDIIHSLNYSGYNNRITGDVIIANKMWKSLPNLLEGSTENILSIVDVSGSMTSKISQGSKVSCMDVAVSLGLYLSERTNGIFKDVFMTFSERPKMVKMKGTLTERLVQMVRSSWGMSTDIQSVFTKLLMVAKQHNVPEDQMPTKLLIVSDMQFNNCMRNGESVSAYEACKQQYEEAGYKLPQIVFWQVNSKGNNCPVTKGTYGTALVSGFSPNIMKSLLKGDLEPTKVMLDTVMIDRYKI